MTYEEKLERLRALMERETAERYAIEYPLLQPDSVRVIRGRKWTRVDRCQGANSTLSSGVYMVDRVGNIYGIRAYGVPDPRRQFGTLDTVGAYSWGGYAAHRKEV